MTSFYEKRRENKFDIILKCSNRTEFECKGKFVITLYDTCYFLHEIDRSYRNYETNDLCMKRNQTEVDLRTRYPLEVLAYLTLVFGRIQSDQTFVEGSYVPWKYLSI